MAFQRQICLFGEIFVLIGDLDSGGPIATVDAYQNFDVSYAHLYPNGAIMRYGKQIGTRDDIELLPTSIDVEPEVGLDKVLFALAFPDVWAAG
jgi:hypothetical protein